MKRHILARLLNMANADPPWDREHQDRFYRIKDRLLKRFGTVVGSDFQRIVKPCWECVDGEIPGDRRFYPGRCWKCHGTGVFDRFFVVLERWNFCGFTFHRPVERRRVRGPQEHVTIEGRIQHEARQPWNCEAILWLSLLYDREMFWGLVSCASPRAGRTPLVLFNRLVFRARMLWRSWSVQLTRRGCADCDRTYRRLWRRKMLWVCRDCARRAQSCREMEDVPF